MKMLPLHQGGVSDDDGGDFPPAAAADQPFRRWKKGSASAAASKNHGKNMASFFWQNEGVHKKTETRQRSRSKQALVARSAWWATPPMPVWALWLLSFATTSPDASRGKILMLK
jgi:hypothetical protein